MSKLVAIQKIKISSSTKIVRQPYFLGLKQAKNLLFNSDFRMSTIGKMN
jgi:hypothetical protein